MSDKATDRTLRFDRPPLARLISCAAAFGSAGLFFQALSLPAGERSSSSLLIFGVLFAGSLLAALVQYGDHIYLTSKGLLYENRWLPMFRGAAGWMTWDDVVEVREVQRKILVLFAADGRRLLVDAISGYALARREILRHTPHAIISGTLIREDRP